MQAVRCRPSILIAILAFASSACDPGECDDPDVDLCPALRSGADPSQVRWSDDPSVDAHTAVAFQAAGDLLAEVPALLEDITYECSELARELGVTPAPPADGAARGGV